MIRLAVFCQVLYFFVTSSRAYGSGPNCAPLLRQEELGAYRITGIGPVTTSASLFRIGEVFRLRIGGEEVAIYDDANGLRAVAIGSADPEGSPVFSGVFAGI